MLQNNIQIFQECWIQKVIDISPFFNRTYTLHYFLLYKSHKTIQMFYRKFADERDNQVNNPRIYNIKRDNLQPLTTGSVLNFFFSVQFRNCIFYAGNSSAKQNIQVKNILEQFWYNKTIIIFIYLCKSTSARYQYHSIFFLTIISF